MAHYTQRILILKDGTEVLHSKTWRGTRNANDETTYRVLPLDAQHCNDRARIVAKSEVARERKRRVEVK